MIECKIYLNKDTPEQPHWIIHNTEVLTKSAELAIEFARQMVTAADMGTAMYEALGGSSELAPHLSPPTLMKVEDIVKRACDLAECLMLGIRSRDWVVNIPNLQQAEEFLASKNVQEPN